MFFKILRVSTSSNVSRFKRQIHVAGTEMHRRPPLQERIHNLLARSVIKLQLPAVNSCRSTSPFELKVMLFLGQPQPMTKQDGKRPRHCYPRQDSSKRWSSLRSSTLSWQRDSLLCITVGWHPLLNPLLSFHSCQSPINLLQS